MFTVEWWARDAGSCPPLGREDVWGGARPASLSPLPTLSQGQQVPAWGTPPARPLPTGQAAPCPGNTPAFLG